MDNRNIRQEWRNDMPITSEILKKYINSIFIETGSHYGNGIQAALDAGFETIYSIELSEYLHDFSRKRFNDYPNVNLIQGDSCVALDDLLGKINKVATLWLDAHFCEGNTAMGKYKSPLIQELEAIGRHHIKNHIIIIDDMRSWNISEYGFDSSDVYNTLTQINKDYKFILEDGHVTNDILVAKL
jgi:hypothetical protein